MPHYCDGYVLESEKMPSSMICDRRVFAASLLFLASFGVSGFANAQNCSDILRDGVFKESVIRQSIYGKYVLAAELTQYEKEEAERRIGVGASAIIYGVPVGANYSDEQYRQWIRSIRNKIQVNQIINHKLDILVSEGDANVISAWRECTRNISSGFFPRLEVDDWRNLDLVLRYKAPVEARDAVLTIAGSTLLENVSVIGGQENLTNGATIESEREKIVNLRRGRRNEPIKITLRTNLGDRSLYLPGLIDLPEPIVSRDVTFELRGGPHIPPFRMSLKVGGGGVRGFQQASPNPGQQNPHSAGCIARKDLSVQASYLSPGLRDTVFSGKIKSRDEGHDGCTTVHATGHWTTCCIVDNHLITYQE